MLCKAQAWRVSLVSALRSLVKSAQTSPFPIALDEGRSREKEKSNAHVVLQITDRA